MIQEYINGHEIDQLHKKIIKIFKKTDFKIDIETNLKNADFLNITFNFKNRNKQLLHINKNSKHPPQIIKKLQKTINDRFCRNSSNTEIFHASK